MSTSRRTFLKSALGGSAVAAFTPAVPGLLQRTACAAAGREPVSDRVLIVIQLSGGNDGLNTLVPYADDVYGRSRRTLRLRADEVLQIDSLLGLHPQMPGFQRLFREGRLTAVQGTGYPQSNRDHDGAMRDWHTAHPGDANYPTGWLGRLADQVSAPGSAKVPTVFVGPIATPFALNARRTVVPSVRAAEGMTLTAQPATPAGPAPVAGDAGANGNRPPLLEVARRNLSAAHQIDQRIRAVLKRPASAAEYPSYTLAGQFHTIAQLIRADVGIRVYFTELGGGGIGGFDNHANQRDNHASLLRTLSESVAALANDLAGDGTLDRVVMMTFSEFGRTVSENGRRGTGHGAAAPMFVVGGQLRGGLVGRHPSLTDLEGDAPKFHTDFRQVYATMLDRWLGLDSRAILGGDFAPLELFG